MIYHLHYCMIVIILYYFVGMLIITILNRGKQKRSTSKIGKRFRSEGKFRNSLFNQYFSLCDRCNAFLLLNKMVYNSKCFKYTMCFACK